MKRFQLLAVLVLCGLCIGLESVNAAGKPNILLIVSDDQGYADLGLLNKDILTPNLDQLARDGVRLTNFYVSWPACTPSRGSLLTGRYPQRNGLYDMIRNEAPDYGKKYNWEEYNVSWEKIGGMDLREVLIPSVLKTVGYKSGLYGKWDLGILKRYLPTNRGFDDFYGLVNTGIDYYTHERYGVHSMYRGAERSEEDKGRYCTYLFEQEALRFLKAHHEDPFFIYVPFNAPHSSSSLNPKIRGTVQAPEKYKKMYPPVEPEFRKGKKYGKEAMLPTKAARTRDYRAAVTCMDESIGNLLSELDRQGLRENTIVMFFSDNGGGVGSSNAPLHGHKGQTWEGGIRVPCIVSWPAQLPKGVVSDEFLSSLELLPTFAKAAGAELPKGVILDGFDMMPVLKGEINSPRKEMFWKRRGLLAARVGKWKWVDMKDGGGGLFDLEKDIEEKKDLSKEQPEVLKRVKGRFNQWMREMEAAEPRGPFRDY